jgi:hypothetical protein
MMSDKNTLTLASSLTVVPLTIMLVAIVLYKRRRESANIGVFNTNKIKKTRWCYHHDWYR